MAGCGGWAYTQCVHLGSGVGKTVTTVMHGIQVPTTIPAAPFSSSESAINLCA